MWTPNFQSPARSTRWLLSALFAVLLQAHGSGLLAQVPPSESGTRIFDLTDETFRQVIVDREPGQYLGHPTTVLLEDGRTILAVYPKGHGRGAIVLKRSRDGGITWSGRLVTPQNWATSQEVPTIFRTFLPHAGRRLILFSGLFPIRIASSADDGLTWSELAPIGNYGGIVAMASLARLSDGRYMALFHDDGRFIKESGERDIFRVYKTLSTDGGLTWGPPVEILCRPDADLCEPGLVRSPDGTRIALLLRENSRKFHSMITFSDDEGETWTEPRELPWTLTGDRHTARYAPDGRLFITFRDTARESATQGDWVAWVGSWEDLTGGRDGEYRLRLKDNKKEWDCCYPGLELLPDGTFVATTYGHWITGESPYILSIRIRLDELDARVGN
jgi:hypothetical protein